MNKQRQLIQKIIVGTGLSICLFSGFANTANGDDPCANEKRQMNQMAAQFSNITTKDNNTIAQLTNELTKTINLYQNCLQNLALGGHVADENTLQSKPVYDPQNLEQTVPSQYKQPSDGNFLKKADTLQPTIKPKQPADSIKWFN